MNISSLTPIPSVVQADSIPLERLAQNSQVSEQAKIHELSRQFEALLVRQILKESRKTVIESGLFDKSFSADLYHDMMDEQIAEEISRSGAMGLARQLEKDLSQRYQNQSTKGGSSDQ